MDNWTEWKAYWWDVLAESFNWAVTLWPIPTVLLGCFVTAITMAIHWQLGQRSEAKNIGISLGVGVIASGVAFFLFVILIGPFLHSKGIAPTLTKLETLFH